MFLTEMNKTNFINTINEKLSQFKEVNKIILFGSFQKSDDNFLTLSLKYRKVLRGLSRIILLDIVPIKQNSKGVFLEEINKGQVVYER